ncbi:hypothetical protein MMC31_001077 [Peltigera leucophlebia]|nr:hypothetical protein [Peltigera leucophlebia]
MKKGWRSKYEMEKKGAGVHLVLAEFAESIADAQDSLWCEVLAPIREDVVKSDRRAISSGSTLTHSLARLAPVNTCNIGLNRVGYCGGVDVTKTRFRSRSDRRSTAVEAKMTGDAESDELTEWQGVGPATGHRPHTSTITPFQYLCDSFIKHDDVRDNAVMFNVGVSAAAQYMIYSASKVFEFCEREGTLLRHLGWVKWKAGFMEAQTNSLINASGKKHATLAVAAMNEAEMGWNRRQGLRGMERNMRGAAARESKGNRVLNVE